MAEVAHLIGPVCELRLADPVLLDRVLASMRAGSQPEDAVLKLMHSLIRQDRGIANEFLAFFLYDLQKLGKFSMSSSSRLRRFLDTGDLVHSVIHDVWEDIPTLEFQTRNQFLTLFAQRMSWKAASKARRLNAGTRCEDRRVFVRPEDIEPTDRGDEIPEQLIRAEERDRLTLVLLKLKPREGKLLALRLKGLEIQEIAEQVGLKYDAARKALSRALKQARSMMAACDRRPVPQSPSRIPPG